MEINPAAGIYDTGELFTEEDLVPDTAKGYMNIPDGELPKFKEGPSAKFPDFRLAVRHWMAYNAGLGNQGNAEGNVSVSFTVGIYTCHPKRKTRSIPHDGGPQV